VGDLLRLVMDLLTAASPFRLVHTWEVGLLYLCGRYQATTRPGLKLILPYFMDVKCVSVVPRNEKTPLNTVTLRDNRTLTYQAALFFQVDDAALAYNGVENWSETVVEIADGLLSELLAETDPERFEPERKKRENLRRKLCDEINAECLRFGVRLLDLWFTQFAIGVRTIRLLGTDRPMPFRH
jgi:regulator of protease activity HflC (stomatin/prohibitin superfamily)